VRIDPNMSDPTEDMFRRLEAQLAEARAKAESLRKDCLRELQACSTARNQAKQAFYERDTLRAELAEAKTGWASQSKLTDEVAGQRDEAMLMAEKVAAEQAEAKARAERAEADVAEVVEKYGDPEQEKPLLATVDAIQNGLEMAFIRAEKAEQQAAGLRAALEKLLGQTSNIEVLGEWEAMDINSGLRKKYRAIVDQVVSDCRSALAAAPAIAAQVDLDAIKREAVEEWIEQNSFSACDCCQHVYIDVTSVKTGVEQHCIAGDPEGDGSGCAWGFHHDLPRREREAAAEALRGMEKEFRDGAELSRKAYNHVDMDYSLLAADLLRIKAERIEAEVAELRGGA
jgi:hypothetical protein